mgnify:CR=1 FL=1
MALGEAIDNSQLSRFEKGKAIPSFEKLRALARIFNVSVQTFSDVLDVERFEEFKPESDDFDGLLRAGDDLIGAGDHGKAFVAYERAVEVAGAGDASPRSAERAAEARCDMAGALRGLGKLAMTEREFREILKTRSLLSRRTQTRALLGLAYVYREMGDYYLASVLAREALDLAAADGDLKNQAGVLNSLGTIHLDEGDAERALGYCQRAIQVLESVGGQESARATAMTNCGACLVAVGRCDEGIRCLQEALARAREHGFRRVAAVALSRLAEAHLEKGDHERASAFLAESDALASRADEMYNDILFLNTYYRWEMARAEENPTREKIAFGRLRHLRALIERRFPEVEQFDRHVEKIGRSHAN